MAHSTNVTRFGFRALSSKRGHTIGRKRQKRRWSESPSREILRGEFERKLPKCFRKLREKNRIGNFFPLFLSWLEKTSEEIFFPEATASKNSSMENEIKFNFSLDKQFPGGETEKTLIEPLSDFQVMKSYSTEAFSPGTSGSWLQPCNFATYYFLHLFLTINFPHSPGLSTAHFRED